MGEISNDKQAKSNINNDEIFFHHFDKAASLVKKCEKFYGKDSLEYKRILKELREANIAFNIAKESNGKVTKEELSGLLKEINDVNILINNAAKNYKIKKSEKTIFDDIGEEIEKTIGNVGESVSSAVTIVKSEISDILGNGDKKKFKKNKKKSHNSEKYYEIKEVNEFRWREVNLPKARKNLKNIEKEILNTDKKSKKYQDLLNQKKRLENIIAKAVSILKEHNAGKKLNEALGKRDNSISYKIDKESETITRNTLRENKNEVSSKSKNDDKEENKNEANTKKIDSKEESKERHDYYAIRTDSGEVKAYTGINGGKQISIFVSDLTISEKENLKNNPESIKKLIDFKSFLEETGLGFLWDYRYKLKIALAKDNNFYNYEDGVSAREQLELLNFVGEKLGFTKSEDLAYLKELFEQKSRLSVFEANGKKYENNSDKNIFEQVLEGKIIDKGKWIEENKKH